MKKARIFSIVIAMVAAAFLPSCVYAPYDGQYVTSKSPIAFRGYAVDAEDEVSIWAYNQSTSTWDELATTTSSSTPTTIGGDTLYAWSYNLDLNTVPSWICYWSPTCTWPSEGVYTAQFRVEEASSYYLPSMEEDGVSCVIDELNNGTGWLAAGQECSSPNSPVINLKIAIIW
ncbi:MAG: hypothetical protein JXR76_28660 [Deltaproteobacteria bacterium]|nr:hypothetical protein [Deltaproteobacteria bacterium]